MLTGDIGFGVFENFQSKNLDRFINMGIAEQNMISTAAGLSKEGLFPIVYTIIPFLLMRPFEQIRVDLAMHDRKVLLVGVGGGYSYDTLGPTHHALEDISLMKSLPGVEIFSPGSPEQLRDVSSQLFQIKGTGYLRLGKNGEKDFGAGYQYDESSSSHSEGTHKTNYVISHGPISFEVYKALQELRNEVNVKFCHISLSKVHPLPDQVFDRILTNGSKIFVVEESYSVGSTYFDLLDAKNKKNDLVNCHIYNLNPPTNFYKDVHLRESILKNLGMDSFSISVWIKSKLQGSI